MGRILIVDDMPVSIKVLGEFLSQEYEVAVATSGRQALESADRNPPDLVLMDVVMPEMDGFEVCRRLRQNPKLVGVPVIFLTALADSDDVVRGFEAGGQDYILKPYKKGEVLLRVKTHMELKLAKEKLDQYAQELERKNKELQQAMEEIRTLRGILPICSYCKKIRNDEGYWDQVESYVTKHTHAEFTHSICPDCLQRYYPAEWASIQQRKGSG
ncbi:Response regulator receiver domain-containing protein [Desulfacinum infernum DSM 9756]|uniref:Response regulator receiver domain-containing protein n=1 Tax=Desulfacinum infernum DSM 9756 TaxID=1121391 RepID=A0A1M4TLT2_9BACT|nr:response regulator [Desulfacinum infernum]SHE45356.1 Response regulator receiver domain-containing protein [Desulfacinum infernum DSM 9756]